MAIYQYQAVPLAQTKAKKSMLWSPAVQGQCQNTEGLCHICVVKCLKEVWGGDNVYIAGTQKLQKQKK